MAFSRWLVAIGSALALSCEAVTPVEKVVELLKKLEAKIEEEGKAEVAFGVSGGRASRVLSHGDRSAWRGETDFAMELLQILELPQSRKSQQNLIWASKGYPSFWSCPRFAEQAAPARQCTSTVFDHCALQHSARGAPAPGGI